MAMAEGAMLQVIVALLIGYAITRAGESGERVMAFVTATI